MTVGIYTLGCRVNQYESEAIAEELERRGYEVKKSGECEAYIINTCTVTAESARKARQFIRRSDPSAYILVTGCYSQTEPEAVGRIEGVDYICGTANKLSVVDALDALVRRGKKNKRPEYAVPGLAGAGFERMCISSFGRTRAYVKIEDGCANRCAYCIIPSARGPVRSKAPEDVVREVKGLVAAGYSEIVLTGIETSAYGADFGCTLTDLLAQIDNVDGLCRLRLGSLDPKFADESFARFAAGSKHLCHHFHLSLQSGCDRTLAAMRRKYNTAQVRENIARLRTLMPDVNFSADIIVGFPGESQEDFDTTCLFAEEIKLLHGHIFSYSKRPGTEAADMPGQIDEGIKSERNRILTGICDRTGAAIARACVGREYDVLFETCREGIATGHTDNFLEVSCEGDGLHGQVRRVKITDGGAVCKGELV